MASSSSQEPRNVLPGFGLPLVNLPQWHPWRVEDERKRERLPHAISDHVASKGVTLRERRMLEFIGQISDKPEWDRKVFDESIVVKWKEEAYRFVEELDDKFLSEKMFDFCIAELREKAKRFQENRVIHVLDAEATIVKSDTMIPLELKQALRQGVESLENVPDRLKDWHPGSDEKVLDLLHPSLFPLTYGESRALPYGTVPLADCVTFTGKGETLSIGEEELKKQTRQGSWLNSTDLKAWGNYQWLPSDVHFGADGSAKIASYVNNLHPQQHPQLYSVLGQFVHHAIPLWNESLSFFHDRMRIAVDGTSDDDFFLPKGLKWPGRPECENHGNDNPEDSDDSREYRHDNGYRDWKKQHRILKQLEPGDFTPFAASLESKPPGACPIDLRKDFPTGLQVIFKLANIHLTPEKPEYDGSSWHVEGALNEHICATALYYYDSSNVTDSRLEFRQSIDAEELTMKPAQDEYESLEQYYGVQNEEAAIQELGSVLTRENRLLTFPNIMQHRVRPFNLADPTKEGHRKLLAMFLVDPHIRVVSTAHVPPQRKDWWAVEVRKIERFAKLPQELFDRIIEAVEGFPISWDHALDIRLKLMAERGVMNDEMDQGMTTETFFFCEH